MNTLLFIALAGILAVVIPIVLWRWKRIPRLNSLESRRIWNEWRRVERLTDPYRQVLEADALVGNVLIDIGFGETFGEALKNKGPYIPNLDRVWQAHKLRNRLAHEPGTPVTEAAAKDTLATYLPLLKKFCRS